MKNVFAFRRKTKVSYKTLLSNEKYLDAKKKVSRAMYEPGMSLSKANNELYNVILEIEREHEKSLTEQSFAEAFK